MPISTKQKIVIGALAFAALLFIIVIFADAIFISDLFGVSTDPTAGISIHNDLLIPEDTVVQEDPRQSMDQEIDRFKELLEDIEENSDESEVKGEQIVKTEVSTPVVEETPKSVTPDPSSCPVSTQACVPCTVGEHWACRVEPGETEGYLGWSCQNNNPGNIRYSDSRISLITSHGGEAPCGMREDSRGGTYMIFSTYSAGRNALKAYLKAVDAGDHSAYVDIGCGECTLQDFFKKYAPLADNNLPSAYAGYVASWNGVDSYTTTLRWMILHKFDGMIDAMQSKEGWYVQ